MTDDPLLRETTAEVHAQAVRFKPTWWSSGIPDPYWPTPLNALRASTKRPGFLVIARSDVFELASDTSPLGQVRLLAAAYAWGTGESGFLVGRRIRTFTRTDLDTVADRLHAARTMMDEQGAVAAYDSLHTKGRNHIPFMGPAFFTKYLYFAAGPQPTVNPAPLILDRLVATGLRQHAGWTITNAGWSSSTYGDYVAYAHSLAADATPDRAAECVEKALFDLGRTRLRPK